MKLRDIVMTTALAVAGGLPLIASAEVRVMDRAVSAGSFGNDRGAAAPAPNGFVDTGDGWGSFYSFRSSTGAYGGQQLAITHDDGVSVYAYIDGRSRPVLVPGTTADPAAPVTETVTLPSGTTRYSVVHSRAKSASPVRRLASVPEPATWMMIVVGFAVVGYGLRRMFRRSERMFEARIRGIVDSEG